MVVPVDHSAVPLLYLHGGILVEVVVFLVGRGVTGGIDAERQPVARRNAGVGVFGHGQLFAGGKVKDPDIARRMIVDGGISKARRGRQDQQTAGKGGVIRGLQRKHFRTGLVEQAAAPPAGGGVVRPLAEVVVRLAGDAVRQQVGSLCNRGLAQHRVPAEDGIAARCIVAVQDAQFAVLQGSGVVVLGRVLLLLGRAGSRSGRLGQHRAGRQQSCRHGEAERGAADTEKFLFHHSYLTGSREKIRGKDSHLIIIRNTRTFHCIGTSGCGYNLVTASQAFAVSASSILTSWWRKGKRKGTVTTKVSTSAMG